MAGQSNHFLITLLVGLGSVEDGTAQVRPEMRTSWAPHDRARSAHRSREFAIKALLAWLMDAVGSYTRIVQTSPALVSEEIRYNLESASRGDKGLAARIHALATDTGQARSGEVALLEVAAAWRNRLVHNHATGRLSNAAVGSAMEQSELFLESYQGLDVGDLIERARRSPAHAPTFKEATAIVRCAHKFVERADEALLLGIDLEPYLWEVLRLYLVKDVEARPDTLMRRASNIWSRSFDRRRTTMRNIAINAGFSASGEAPLNQLDPAVVDRIATWTPSEAALKLGARTDQPSNP